MPPIQDVGQINSIDLIKQQISLAGKFVVDAGCGSMAFTRPLVEHGARVLAIDPDPVQAELNRQETPQENLEFVETGAEKIPVRDQSVDGVFFSYSLHHIPASIYPQVFAEVFRVLKPDGFLFVIEPADSTLNEVMKLFHDEDRERTEAQIALFDVAIPAFQTAQQFTYHSYVQYDSFEHFAKRFSSQSFNELYTAEDVRKPAVREAFERQGAPDYRFQSPKLAMLLQRPLR